MYFNMFSSYNQRKAWINSYFDYPISVNGLVEIPPAVGDERVYVAVVLESLEEAKEFSNSINGTDRELFVKMLCMKIVQLINKQDGGLMGCGIDVSVVSKMYGTD